MEQFKHDLAVMRQPLSLFLFCGCFLVGLFNEPAGALCSVILALLLLLRLYKEKKLSLSLNLTTLCVAVICAGFLLSALWAKDRYYALLGFVKFLPLLLFLLTLGASPDFDAEQALIHVPYAGAIMTLISYPLSKIDSIAYLFSVDGRIAGFFQYPNSFALFLILGIVILAFQKKMTVLYGALGVILVFGIFMSGSRTSFVLFILTALVLLFLSKNKALKWVLLSITLLMIVAAVVVFLFSNRYGALGRFLTISSTAGTFKARLLYMKDALKVIVKHPFGIGYMSYYFTQGSFQTGFYTNRFVHNELLQLLLDIGWLPTAAAVFCAVRCFLSKEKSLLLKLLLAIILLHAMLDFDLQFLSICFIALICVQEKSAPIEFKPKKGARRFVTALAALLCLFSVWLGASSACFLLMRYDAAVKICPSNTMAQIERLNAQQDDYKRYHIAQTIMNNNRSVSNAYYAIAKYQYSKGNLREYARNFEFCIRHNRYGQEAYTIFASGLINAARHFEAAGKKSDLNFCVSRLTRLQKQMQAANAQADALARYLPEHQTLAFDAQTREEIERLQKTTEASTAREQTNAPAGG